MITILNSKMIIPEEERVIGYLGDNAVTTKQFEVINGNTNLTYKLYLKFKSGAVNFLILPSSAALTGVTLTWNIKKEHLTENGLVSAQIKAYSANGEIWHTNEDYFEVSDSLDYSEYFASPIVSEFLQFEQNIETKIDSIKELDAHPPIIGSNKNWFCYNDETKQYEDSGNSSQGTQGPKGDPGTVNDFSVTTQKLATNAVTTDKIKSGAIAPENTDFLTIGKNKFNYKTSTAGTITFQYANGINSTATGVNIIADYKSKTSDYIYAPNLQRFMISPQIHAIAFYDSEKNAIGLSNVNQVIPPEFNSIFNGCPVNNYCGLGTDGYIRFSYLISDESSVMLEFIDNGVTTPSAYESFYYEFDGALNDDAIYTAINDAQTSADSALSVAQTNATNITNETHNRRDADNLLQSLISTNTNNISSINTSLSALAAKAINPTAGHIATLDANGNIVDSGKSFDNISTEASGITYNTTGSVLSSTNVQDAINEVANLSLNIDTIVNKTVDSWAAVQNIVRAGKASKIFKVGDQLQCSHSEYGTITWDIIGIDAETPSDNTKTHSLTLQTHKCLPLYNGNTITTTSSSSNTVTLYFDNSQTNWANVNFYCWGNQSGVQAMTLVSGTTSLYTIAVNPSNISGFLFKETNDTSTWNYQTVNLTFPTVPANCYTPSASGTKPAGSWTTYPNYEYWDYPEKLYALTTNSTFLSGKTYYTYDGTNYNAATVTVGSAVTANTYYEKNDANRATYGNNNWLQSNIRQWLNSSAVNWFNAKNIWDTHTSATNSGFLYGLDSDFTAVLGNVKKYTALPSIDGGGFASSDELIFLPSVTEVYGGNNNGIAEGNAYPYYAAMASSTTTNNVSKRIKYYSSIYSNGSAAASDCFLRSPAVSNSYNIEVVNHLGGIGNCAANSANQFSPICVII
ncbi:MAG: DUF6273 domain-containing protein [Bacillota bacterium]|nr:DUF6273 domain-containing protein [Bacillota bacterium]